ncbi:MAG TPA: NADPH:quinone reductase [Syntrophorhabdales bacterium]|nr:NADPH:quinone reductase [Syntrophorhabdales bacterium]
MKRVRVHQFGGPEVLRIEEAPDPRPGPGEVLVKAHAVGINPVETYIRSGTYTPRPELPYTPGTDASGIVEAIGKGVTDVKPGDRVYSSGTITGAYAEKALCRRFQIHRLPPDVPFAKGAAVGVPYTAAYRALFQRAKAAPADVLLIHGADGTVGVAAMQFARAWGITIIATVGSDEGRDLAARQGARHIVNHFDADHGDRILALTDGRGVDVILEMLASVNLGKDLPLLAPSGRVVIIGSRGTVEINPRDLMRPETAILGMLVFSASEADQASIHAAIEAGLENGTLDPLMGREMAFNEAAEAHRFLETAKPLGKIVLLPAP